jgi:hypothetical protein
LDCSNTFKAALCSTLSRIRRREEVSTLRTTQPRQSSCNDFTTRATNLFCSCYDNNTTILTTLRLFPSSVPSFQTHTLSPGRIHPRTFEFTSRSHSHRKNVLRFCPQEPTPVQIKFPGSQELRISLSHNLQLLPAKSIMGGPEISKLYVPLTCHGHSRPVTHLSFSDWADEGDIYYLISACKGIFCRGRGKE